MTDIWDGLRREARFRLWARASGQVLCADGHEEWWLKAWRTRACPHCGAVV